MRTLRSPEVRFLQLPPLAALTLSLAALTLTPVASGSSIVGHSPALKGVSGEVAFLRVETLAQRQSPTWRNDRASDVGLYRHCTSAVCPQLAEPCFLKEHSSSQSVCVLFAVPKRRSPHSRTLKRRATWMRRRPKNHFIVRQEPLSSPRSSDALSPCTAALLCVNYAVYAGVFHRHAGDAAEWRPFSDRVSHRRCAVVRTGGLSGAFRFEALSQRKRQCDARRKRCQTLSEKARLSPSNFRDRGGGNGRSGARRAVLVIREDF